MEKNNWLKMVSDDPLIQEAILNRVGQESPNVLKILEFFSLNFKPIDGYGFTVFTDWILNNWKKASAIWPDDLCVNEAHRIYGVVFPPKY